MLTLLDRLQRHYTEDEQSGCWLWHGALDQDGYGAMRVDGHMVRAHRVAYQLLAGPIPDGLVIDHVRERGCLNRNCVNPAHLEPVTNAVNVQRGTSPSSVARERTDCSEGHPLVGTPGKRYCPECRRTNSRRRLRARRGGIGMPLCDIAGCDRSAYVKGLCVAHYQQQRREAQKESA